MNLRADEILETDHGELDGLLADVQIALSSDDLYLTYTRLDVFWARLAMHIRAEHLQLFPALLAASKPTGKIEEMLKFLRKDHDFFMTELGSVMKVFRDASDNNADEVMNTVRNKMADLTTRLEEHNTLEELQLYPLVAELSDPDAEHLEAGIKKELNNLPHRFNVAG